ncbi:glycosyltransferase [Flavobacterium notoginsengisoli]|uniref:glycosyltransferase n=1 Tax=Flavobacterium notoginsengisoli TaxID=1478199 RepID=UPI003628C2D4
MKILMVSIPTLHFFRWVNQLEDSGHEVYWFDITGMSNSIEKISWVSQKVNWKMRWNYPGRTFLKKKYPGTYQVLKKINEYKTESVFEKYFDCVKPDVVHSFSIQIGSLPILNVMKKHRDVKWIYSSWGSDIFNKKGKENFDSNLRELFLRVNYMFADNKRDFEIAKDYGFKGTSLGIFPGGGGYDLALIEQFSIPLKDRNVILIKGYEGNLGRCNVVLNAIKDLKKELESFKIVVFGAPQKVFEFVKNSELNAWENLKIYGAITHKEVLSLMGSAKIYIGNSISDGMPNTLLEAICSGAFPIQSNPGKVTEEIIKDCFNGRLISNPDNVEQIKELILETLQQNTEQGVNYNLDILSAKLEIKYVSNEIKHIYNQLK